MKVVVDTAVLSRGTLTLGCKIIGPGGTWVRFTVVTVPDHLMTYRLRSELLECFDQADEREPDAPTLF